MKKILFILFILASVYSFGQTNIQFKTTHHNFGKIKKGKPVTFAFGFINNDNRPLIVEVATAECGCTTPDYPKEPIPKGKSEKIKVTYNAESKGSFSKKVTVKFADSDEPVILTIEGEVI